MSNTVKLSTIEIGKAFEVGGIEFIKFSDKDGITTAVSKGIIFNSVFGEDNNFRTSKVLKRLNEEVLPKLIDTVGEDNICEIHTDLTTLDGLKPYEPLVSKISLPTFDFYRENVDMFDKYKVDGWWWLATPDSAKPHYDPIWIRCVSPFGDIYGISYDNTLGVRPVLNFVSSISVSCE